MQSFIRLPKGFCNLVQNADDNPDVPLADSTIRQNLLIRFPNGNCTLKTRYLTVYGYIIL